MIATSRPYGQPFTAPSHMLCMVHRHMQPPLEPSSPAAPAAPPGTQRQVAATQPGSPVSLPLLYQRPGRLGRLCIPPAGGRFKGMPAQCAKNTGRISQARLPRQHLRPVAASHQLHTRPSQRCNAYGITQPDALIDTSDISHIHERMRGIRALLASSLTDARQ